MSLNRMLPALVFGALVLTGCSSAEKAAEPSAPAADGRCDASKVQGLIGKPLSAALVEQARRDAGAQTARALRPHDAMSLEYNSTRLNINVDDSQVVRSLNCG